ncbi:CASP-like protein N24 [Vigna unguiculata]|uniref:CASP-like protein N24 n=1 Tax=Vigna unguiculata TaxID=3917 RepID=UPI0010170C80|nr:CASP-like protein N24 [Vigna unguiculata]
MATTKSEAPSQEKKGDRMKRHSEKTEEEEEELKPSKKKEQSHHRHNHNHHHSISKPPSAPTLQDSFNNSHSNHSFSDGDLQIVAASHSHESISDDAIKVVKEAVNKTVKSVPVMAVENVEEGARHHANNNGDEDGVSKKKVSKWYIVLLCLRIAAFVFCKIAFSVLASDRRKKVRKAPSKRWNESPPDTWYTFTVETPATTQLDSDELHWYDLEEFKYCLSVNVIGFVYSALQIFDLGKYFITKRHTMNPKLRAYLNFAMDQVMAYLVLSASSSAATTAHYWSKEVSDGDKFLEIAKASVALSFIAFVAFASTSIVSAFIFCRFN